MIKRVESLCDARHALANTLAKELGVNPKRPGMMAATDKILMMLWVEGYKIVPLEAECGSHS